MDTVRLSCNTRKRAISTLSGLRLDEPRKSIEHLTQRVALCDHLQNFCFTNVESREGGADVTQEYKNARSNEYATGGDFCRIYLEQMNNLYLLALLLTADPQKAEQCHLSGFDDPVSNNSVFKDRTYLWARRSTILHAIQLLCPR
jgi:hypothetical protein